MAAPESTVIIKIIENGPAILTAIAAIIGAIGSVIATWKIGKTKTDIIDGQKVAREVIGSKIEEVKHQAGSLTTQLVESEKRASHAEGKEEGRKEVVIGLLRTPKILLVDDDPLCYDRFKEKLQDRSELTWVQTAEKGLKLLEEQKGDFDCVITDERLPTMQGHEMIKEVRRQWPAVTTVISTQFEFTSSVLNEIKTLGLTFYLPKPIQDDDVTALLATIKSLQKLRPVVPALIEANVG